MKEYIGSDTYRLNLEHHYWIKDSFLEKIGRMAPSLKELCLRRLKISNKAFSAIAMELKRLERIDISDCYLIEDSSVRVMLDNNPNLKYI